MSKVDNKAFHEPKDFGCFDLLTSHVDKIFNTIWDTAVISGLKAVIHSDVKVLKTLTEGGGLIVSGDRLGVDIVVNGEDFKDYAGETLKISCNFWVLGDIEFTFDLQVIKSVLD